MAAYDRALQFGGEAGKRDADEAERKIKLVTYQLLAKMDDIYSYLKGRR